MKKETKLAEDHISPNRRTIQEESEPHGTFPFRSKPPGVRLLREESTTHPFALTIGAAWSCYGPKPASVQNIRNLVDRDTWGELDPETRAERERRRKRAVKLYADLFAAGHHTTFQHASFVFAVDNVSRLALWSFFHPHPFYNSEQVSQRYREVSGKSMVVPDLSEDARAIYQDAIDASLDGYQKLTEILSEDFSQDYAAVFPGRAKGRSDSARKRFQDDVQKRAQEVARYVLPLATPSHLYHTVNSLTLLRYYVLANQPDAPREVRYIVNRMVDEVLAMDPCFLGAEEAPLDLRILGPADSLESHTFAAWRTSGNVDSDDIEQSLREFDEELAGGSSKLVQAADDAESTFAKAIRMTMGVSEHSISDAEAISQVLDGSKNPALAHSLYLAMNSKLMQTMNHVTFTFMKSISGAEDAQNQRHRGTPGSRPLLLAHMRREPDVIHPWAICRNPQALETYDDTISRMWSAKNQLHDMGVDPKTLLYLLPNSHKIRFYESGSLLTYYWKWIKRLCFDAQREIFETATEEVAQVRDRYPLIGQYIDGPPCVLRSRSGVAPICPEGERFCGVPVWRDYAFESLGNRRVM